jgi:hypothetical protein
MAREPFFGIAMAASVLVLVPALFRGSSRISEE